MLGDGCWLEDAYTRYAYYVERSRDRERVPRPFESFASEILFDDFVTMVRFERVLRKWEWLSPGAGDVPTTKGNFGPRDLVRFRTVIRELGDRALKALREHDKPICRLVARYILEDEWAYSRYGLERAEAQERVDKAKRFLFDLLTLSAEMV